MKPFILSLALVLTAVCSSFAQVTNTVVEATTLSPAGQAPDDVLQKISGLVHEGKYTDAKQTVSALLILYPDDQKLPKLKVLLDKLAVPQTANTSSAADNHVPDQQTNAVTGEQLAGMDRVEYHSLMILGHEAQQTTDLNQQKTLLKKFMDDSGQFLQKHPDEMQLWQLRAASALMLNDMLAGYEAGQRLLAMGAADSNDPNILNLLSQLNLKDWLDKEKVAARQKEEENEGRIGWILGVWDVVYTWHSGTLGANNMKGGRGKEEFEISGSSIEGYEISNSGKKCSGPDLRGAILDMGQINWECYLPPSTPGDLYFFREYGSGMGSVMVGSELETPEWITNMGNDAFYPSGWQPVVSYSATNLDAFTIVLPSQNANPKSEMPLKHPVTLVFTKAGDQQRQPEP